MQATGRKPSSVAISPSWSSQACNTAPLVPTCSSFRWACARRLPSEASIAVLCSVCNICLLAAAAPLVLKQKLSIANADARTPKFWLVMLERALHYNYPSGGPFS